MCATAYTYALGSIFHVHGDRISACYVRPYGLVGVGLIKTAVTPTALLPGASLTVRSNALGWSIGGGLFVTYNHVGLRADLRVLRSLDGLDVGLLGGQSKRHFSRATIGLVLQ